jgi:hypothetical protein
MMPLDLPAIDEYDYLDENTTAKTTTFREFEGTIIDWSWFFHKKTGKIPFLIRKDIMASDEAIVAVIGHEMSRRYDPRRAHSASLNPPAEDQARAAERWICARRTRSSKPVNVRR